MKDYYQTCAIPKPEARKKTKARTKRVHADHVAEVRVYVFGREEGICRCCRVRPADSMHELRPRSLGGKVSKRNSVAVCGDGVQGCHGFMQRHEIRVLIDDQLGAESTLAFEPCTAASSDHMRVPVGQTVCSAPRNAREEIMQRARGIETP